jgi:protein TonB
METRFIIPAAFAMSLHAFVFLAFPPGTIIVPPPLPKPVDFTFVPLIFDDPPPAESTDNPPAARRGTPDPVVRAPDPLVPPRPGVMEIPLLPPSPPIHPDRQITTIPVGPPGDPNGLPSGQGTDLIPGCLLDNPPRTRAQTSPLYPYEARSQNRQGEVLVEFTVDENGRVLDPHIVRSNDPIFDAPTLRAVAKWRFEPGRKNGHVVRFRMVLPVQFAVNS